MVADRLQGVAPPAGAPAAAARAQGSDPLDLVPFEWEVLAAVDGARDLHSLADALGRSEFEVARTVYGLARRSTSSSKNRVGRAGGFLEAAETLRGDLEEQGWNTGVSSSQIIPIIIGSPNAAWSRCAAPPARILGPRDWAAFSPGGRVASALSLTASHTASMILGLLDALGDVQSGKS